MSTLRSMTGYAQVKGQYGDTAFTLSLKSVNHRFLDLHLRLPAGADALEQSIRRMFKERMHRGHIELTLSLDYAGGAAVSVNRAIVAGYVHAFRQVAEELKISGEPDLNAIFRLNGVMTGGGEIPADEGSQKAVMAKVEEAIEKLNSMRAHEGNQMARELRERLVRMEVATNEIEKLRGAVAKAHMEKIESRMKELLDTKVDPDRILQEAAMLAERSDIHEEIVRMKTHIEHFRGLLDDGAEVGKKLDFLMQEMNREANTMLSKTSGVAGEALRITELGLALKADIEKAREQVQNIE
jgi:uncharacterized protein (TIGR00255 family)